VQREHALGEVLQLVSQAESGQRGYVLVGDTRYLAPYQEAVQRLPNSLAQLKDVFATASPNVRADVSEIERLSRAKFAEMDETLQLYRQRGRSAAVALVRTDAGQETMTQLTQHARSNQNAEADAILDVSRTWRADRWVSLALMTGAAAVSLLLLYVLRRLVQRYIFSKERETEALNERQGELERAVQRSTEDLSELSTHLQIVAEKERATLSRELHDELGGLLVAARMDVSWLEERIATSDPEVLEHFQRVQDALLAGVDLKRRVVESLRPTLLDNLGLFPALRWQVAESCGRAGIQCVERYPQEDLALNPEAAIAIFRIVQESLTNILKHARARNVQIVVESQGKWLLLQIRDDGVGLPVDRRRTLRSHGLAAMRHRAIGFGGQWHITTGAGGGTEIEVLLPLDRITAVPAAAAAF
jgi:signal transduction histidine kinase